jgi:predicted neuraminidase
MLLRSASGYIFRADSTDLGYTWSAAYMTALPNNNSGIDIVTTPDNTLALVCNPVASNWGKRSPLILITSSDNGVSWNKPLNLAEGEGEYSYPAIICADGRLHITFTWQRTTIMYCEVKI